MVRGSALHEVLRSHEDPELIERWQAQMVERLEHLAQKAPLSKQQEHRTQSLDFMFMKLPGLDEDGFRVPRNEAVGPALDGHMQREALAALRRSG